MADNTFYISAGLPPNDNDPGDNPNTFHVSAGLVPDDTEDSGSTLLLNGSLAGMQGVVTRKRSYNRLLTGGI